MNAKTNAVLWHMKLCVKVGRFCVILVGKECNLKLFALTQTCYNVHELLFKGEDEGVPQMDCRVDSSGMYCASLIGGVVFDQ